MKILVVDDDSATREGLAKIFKNEGYETICAEDGISALRIFEKEKPEFLCLDVMMPGRDGYQVCQQIRKIDETVPILFISAKGEEIDKVLGMELGADDFIVKPFGVREVVARIRAITRRFLASKNSPREKTGKSVSSFVIGDLEVFPLELRAKRSSSVIDLNLREVRILEMFFKHPGEVLNRVVIGEECWGSELVPVSRAIDQQISQLRKRIELDPENPKIISTVHGAGYRYDKREDK